MIAIYEHRLFISRMFINYKWTHDQSHGFIIEQKFNSKWQTATSSSTAAFKYSTAFRRTSAALRTRFQTTFFTRFQLQKYFFLLCRKIKCNIWIMNGKCHEQKETDGAIFKQKLICLKMLIFSISFCSRKVTFSLFAKKGPSRLLNSKQENRISRTLLESVRIESSNYSLTHNNLESIKFFH